MEAPEFFYCENRKCLPGAGLILYTTPPCYTAKIFRFENRDNMEWFIKKYDLGDSYGKVDGYNILVCYIGNVDHLQELPVKGELLTSKIISVLKKMASFYMEERINGNETRLKKYKEILS